MLSLVIPTLNAAAHLRSTLAALAPELHDAEIVVADGGSTDDTVAVAERAGARPIVAQRGRGTQLHAGAAAARGEWLLFLHADTRPLPGWRTIVDAFAADTGNARRAAVFRLTLDDDDPRARTIERAAGWRARRLALPYGDQGLLIARAFYEHLGGYPAIPIMEDVALIRRIARHRLSLLPHPVLTSAERYRRDGWRLRPLRNLTLLSLYLLGVRPQLLRRLYG
jgi:rSAM/selenodomain-associated transferase 2